MTPLTPMAEAQRLYAWVEDFELEGLVRVTWDKAPTDPVAYPERIEYWLDGKWNEAPWLAVDFMPGLINSHLARSDRVAEVDEAYALKVQAAG